MFFPPGSSLPEVRRSVSMKNETFFATCPAKSRRQHVARTDCSCWLVVWIANRVGLKLAEHSKLEVHIVVGFDDDSRRAGNVPTRKRQRCVGSGTMCGCACPCTTAIARATSPAAMLRTDLEVFRVISSGVVSIRRRAAHAHSKQCIGAQAALSVPRASPSEGARLPPAPGFPIALGDKALSTRHERRQQESARNWVAKVLQLGRGRRVRRPWRCCGRCALTLLRERRPRVLAPPLSRPLSGDIVQLGSISPHSAIIEVDAHGEVSFRDAQPAPSLF